MTTTSSIRSPSPHINHNRCGSSTLLRQLTDHSFSSYPIPPPPDNLRATSSSLLPNSGPYVSTSRANSLASNLHCSQQGSSENFHQRARQGHFNLVVSAGDDGEDSTKNVKNPRGQQRKRFFKTRLCPYHFKKGSACKGGIHCSYAHSFSELRPSVDLTKTKLCHDYLSGLCNRKADECPFAHGSTELRPVRPTTEGCLLTLPDPHYARCATSNELWEISKLPATLDRAHTFETHATVDAGRCVPSSTNSLVESYYTPSPAASLTASRFLMSPAKSDLNVSALLATGSKSTDTAISTQSSGPLITPRTRQNLVSIADHQASQIIANFPSGSNAGDLLETMAGSAPVALEDGQQIDMSAAQENQAAETSASPHQSTVYQGLSATTLPASRSGLFLQEQQVSPVSHPPTSRVGSQDMFGAAVPGADDEPKLTLTVSQLANIILAAHAAESPADLVNDVLSYIYKT